MEEKKYTISLGTAICIFLIILLLAGIGMLAYTNYITGQKLEDSEIALNEKNKENSTIIVEEQKPESEIIVPETDNPNDVISKNISDFDLIYNSVLNYISNKPDFITSDNEIENVVINNITIYTKEYISVAGSHIPEELLKDENIIVGYCSYSIQFKDISNLSLAGSKGDISGITGNWFVNGSLFEYNKLNKTIEFVTGF